MKKSDKLGILIGILNVTTICLTIAKIIVKNRENDN